MQVVIGVHDCVLRIESIPANDLFEWYPTAHLRKDQGRGIVEFSRGITLTYSARDLASPQGRIARACDK